jgi:CDP-glucose 4,6-dehydratase
MNPQFWSGKRVFVTGHTGFKGSWLCMLLNSLGARVGGYALQPPTQPSLFALARVEQWVQGSVGDVRDLASLTQRMQEFAPDVVIHMAAQSVVLSSYADPVTTYSTNVIGTVHSLEALRALNRPCVFVNVTTDKCYDNRGWVWGYRESDALGGRDPYSNSKACAELVGQSYRESFFPVSRWDEHRVSIASARAGNVIGGGDWTPRQLIPEAIAAFREGRPVVLRHPEAVRPWQHVLDCLSGYLRLAQAMVETGAKGSGEWNFGPSETEPLRVCGVVEALAAQWEIARPWVADAQSHASEEMELRLDVSKARAQLGWRCALSTPQALQWTGQWYRDFHRGADAQSLCEEQIARYRGLARG